jgi:uncharacterized protein
LLAINGVVAAPATERSVRELIVATGAENLGAQILKAVMPALRNALPNAPESFWNDFAKDVRPEELVSLIIPVYQHNLTEDDIQSALAFYRSPAGRRLTAMQPVIAQESMQVGQQWGRALAQRAISKFQALPPKVQ